MSPRIRLRLLATLERFQPGGAGELELSGPGRISDLVGSLGIPEGTGRVVLVNGRLAQEDRVLAEGDEVVMFPPVEGG